MYKNKVLGRASALVWEEEAKEGFASLSGNRSLLAPLPDGPLQPLPSFWRHHGRRLWNKITLRLSLCFYSFPSFLANLLTAFPQTPTAPSTPGPHSAGCLAGCPWVRAPSLRLILRILCDTEGR